MRRCAILVVLLAPALAAGACGGSGEENPVLPFEGRYEVAEVFVDQTGTQCEPAPDQPYANGVRVGVDGNELELRFDSRWATLRGQVDALGAMAASGQLGASETLQWSGRLEALAGPPAEQQLSGQLRHIRPACTRTFTVSGTRPAP
jgi:hypothetical protein